MRKGLLSGLMLCMTSLLCAGQPRIAVMNLENKTAYRGVENDLEGGTADMLTTALVNTKKFRVIERAELQKLLEEQKLGASGAVTPQTVAKIGKILGAEYMVIGSVNEYGLKSSDLGAFGVGVKTHTAAVGLDVRVIDTSSAEIAAAATGQCKKSTKALNVDNASLLPTDVQVGSQKFSTSLIGQATRGAVNDAAEKISKDLGGSWSGTVIKVSEGVVTINGGENVDLQSKEVLTVFRKGEEMVDPETGESLGSEEKVIGEIRITDVKPKFANASIIKGDILKDDKVAKK